MLYVLFECTLEKNRIAKISMMKLYIIIASFDVHLYFSTVKFLMSSSSQAGRTEGVCEQLIDSDARALYEAGEGRKGKDCSVFIEILSTRSAPHLRKGNVAHWLFQ